MFAAAIPTEVQVAAVTAAGAALAASVGAVGAWLGKRDARDAVHAVDDVAARVGDPNGRGDLTVMVTALQDRLDWMCQTLSRIVDRQAQQDQRIADLAHTVIDQRNKP